MFGGPWEITCKKDYHPHDSIPDYAAFKAGNNYRVKDKFPDEHGDIKHGIWEISNGSSIVDVSYAERKEYFVLN